MNKKFWIFFVIMDIVIIAAGIWFWQSHKNDHAEEVHYHAGFQVYVNDVKQNFADFKYMKIEPCGTDHSKGDEQLEKAHLHDNIGDVVHVHREAAKWSDLFENIGYAMDPHVVAYFNGQLVPQALTMPIIANGSMVFFVGENTDISEKVAARVSQDHIKDVEAMSEKCGGAG